MARTSSGSSRPRLGRSQAPREDVLSFMRLMWAVDHALQRTSKQMNQSLGLTGPQRLVIRLLGRTPGLSAGHLASELHLDPSTLTGILQRLESRRLVQRQRDPSDARRLRLSLTRRGESFDAPSPGTIEAALTRALEGRSPREVNAAKTVLTSIAEELSVSPQPATKSKRAREAAGARARR
jgi:DNA-binding MarR family transcriptional regulator